MLFSVKVLLQRKFVVRHRLNVPGEWRGDVLVVDRDVWDHAGVAGRVPGWPDWALALAKRARVGDKGLGDVVAREIGPFGSDVFKVWYAGVAGVMAATCRCAGWQPIWNARYPVLMDG